MINNTFLSRLNWLIKGRNIRGLQSYDLFVPKTNYNNYAEELEKIRVVMSNPALLKVIKLQADLFSIGKFVEKTPSGEIVENSEMLDLLNYPNFFTTNQKQFLWDYIFWRSLGTARLMIDKNLRDFKKSNLYFLDNSKIEYPQFILDNGDKFILTDQTFKKFQDSLIKYTYLDGTTEKIPLKKVLHFFDNTNTTGNWYNGFSTIETLYKVLSNSELGLDAKNTNLNLAGQFMVSSNNGIESSMMQADDKKNIETKIGKGEKNIHAVRTAIDIKRFVENIANLKLDDSYLHDYFTIGSIYGIPKDVLEAFNSGTYENQETARMSLVDYVLSPKSEDLCDSLTNYFDYPNKLYLSWDHCSFMQQSETMRYNKELRRANVLRRLLDSGVDPEDATRLLNYSFEKPINYDPNKRTTRAISESENG